MIVGFRIIGAVLVRPRHSRDHPGHLQGELVERRPGSPTPTRRSRPMLHSRALDVTFGVLIILTLLGSGWSGWKGADRTQAIAALDGAGPSWMGRLPRLGTPVTVNIMLRARRFGLRSSCSSSPAAAWPSFFSVMIALGHLDHVGQLRVRLPGPGRAAAQVPGRARPFIGCRSAWPGPGSRRSSPNCSSSSPRSRCCRPGPSNSWFGQSYSIESGFGVSRSSSSRSRSALRCDGRPGRSSSGRSGRWAGAAA